MTIPKDLFRNHRFPTEIIQYAVWLYFVFPLSFRDVELLLYQRGIIVSHEAIRIWCYKFGPHLARSVRRKRKQTSNKWHLDEVFIKINGRRHYLWRAVDSKGQVIDILVQTQRNAKAAKRFFEAVLGKTDTLPRVIVTDGLRSYNVISCELLPNVEHQRSKYLNNRAENSHQPTRRRERRMQRFKSADQAQKFLSSFDIIYRYFHPPKHRLKAQVYRQQLDTCCKTWDTFVA